MPFYFSMPKLGMNMTEGVIVNWLVREGDVVEAGQPVIDVETDKSVNTIEAPVGGIIARIVKDEGEIVPCTFVMAVIIAPGEEIPREIPEAITDGVRPKAEVEVKIEDNPDARPHTTDQALPGRRISISPSAKVLATELNVDISKIIPSGDRISRKDVQDAYDAMQASQAIQSQGENIRFTAEQSTGPFKKVIRKPVSLIRRRISDRMSASAHAVARVGLTLDINASALMAWRDRLRREELTIGYSELWAKVAAKALQNHPYMNARLENEEIWEIQEINIGIAVDTEAGLVVPVIRDADKKNLTEISQELAEKIERAQQRKSILTDFEAGTFTITSLGALGIESFLPIINYPECAILAIGSIIQKPVFDDDRVQVQPRITLTLAFDHRLVDGAPAARFLSDVKMLVEQSPVE
jgi:pyruvate dehydrogenase E2 component (dihydrolipoamide acetyltransferase)